MCKIRIAMIRIAVMEIETEIAAMTAIACRMVRTGRLAGTSVSKATGSMPCARKETAIGGTHHSSISTAVAEKSQTSTEG